MYAHNQQWLASRARTHSLKAPAVVCHLPPTVRSAAQHSTATPAAYLVPRQARLQHWEEALHVL